MSPLFREALQQHREVFEALPALESTIQRAAARLARSLREGGKLMLCGNGGSAADSQHIAAELTGRFVHERAPLAAIALSTDTSALTCIANDYGYEQVFERQVRALGRPGDCLIAISTSGRSPNVARAVAAAREMDIHCIGLLGRDGGPLASLCEPSVIVPAQHTAHIQEAHIFIGHVWCGLIEAELGLA